MSAGLDKSKHVFNDQLLKWW